MFLNNIHENFIIYARAVPKTGSDHTWLEGILDDDTEFYAKGAGLARRKGGGGR